MRDKLDKLRIEIYGNGIFQGYVKSVSESKQYLKSTMDKKDAKTYSSMIIASKEIDRIHNITRGTLRLNVV